ARSIVTVAAIAPIALDVVQLDAPHVDAVDAHPLATAEESAVAVEFDNPVAHRDKLAVDPAAVLEYDRVRARGGRQRRERNPHCHESDAAAPLHRILLSSHRDER